MSLGKKIYGIIMKLVNFFGYPVKLAVLNGSSRVRVLIEVDGSILLVKNSIGSQKWSLPGGGVHKKELVKIAAAREVYEETGLKIDPDDLHELTTEKNTKAAGLVAYKLIFFTLKLSQIQEPKISRPLEIIEVKWFLRGNLPKDCSDTVMTALTKVQTVSK